jgi:hypothetical protein
MLASGYIPKFTRRKGAALEFGTLMDNGLDTGLAFLKALAGTGPHGAGAAGAFGREPGASGAVMGLLVTDGRFVADAKEFSGTTLRIRGSSTRTGWAESCTGTSSALASSTRRNSRRKGGASSATSRSRRTEAVQPGGLVRQGVSSNKDRKAVRAN